MNTKFDELAKALAQSVTRRQALKQLGVGLAGIAVACLCRVTPAQAGTTTCTTSSECGNNQLCCSGTCISNTDNNNCGLCGNQCPAGTTCKRIVTKGPRGDFHSIGCV